MFQSYSVILAFVAVVQISSAFFITTTSPIHHNGITSLKMTSSTIQDVNDYPLTSSIASRRSFLSKTLTAVTGGSIAIATAPAAPAIAADEEASVQTPLYYILRVREATVQETRLINSGKFKDLQRADVKLAVKFMLTNYRLSDNFIRASAYLQGNKQIQAGNVGTRVVQNLITILEYFDSSDVQNIKIGSSGIAGKQSLVLNGLDATRKDIDEFVSFFPKADVDAVMERINAENELNAKEFDSELGTIINQAPVTSN